MGSCFGQRWFSSAARSGSRSRCRSVSYVSPVSGDWTAWNSWTIANSTENAFALLTNAERFLRDTLPIAGRFEQNRIDRIDEPLYPPLATREALANALCHRDYSIGGGSVGIAIYDDRLEVTSSGSLPFGLTPERLFAPHESRPWNPLIARTFYRRGIIEEWGSGTLKMAAVTGAAGLPMPEIEDDGGVVTVRFRHGIELRATAEFGPMTGSANLSLSRRVLALLDRADQGLARREIHARLGSGASERQVRRALEELRDKGLVVSTNRGPLALWRRSQGHDGGAIGAQ